MVSGSSLGLAPASCACCGSAADGAGEWVCGRAAGGQAQAPAWRPPLSHRTTLRLRPHVHLPKRYLCPGWRCCCAGGEGLGRVAAGAVPRQEGEAQVGGQQQWVGIIGWGPGAPNCSPQLPEQSAAAAAAHAARQQQAAGLTVVVWCCWVGLGLVAGPFFSCRGTCRGPAASPPRCCSRLHPSAPAPQELSEGCRVRKTSWWRVATGSSAAGGGAGGQRQAPRAHCPHPTLRGCRVTS